MIPDLVPDDYWHSLLSRADPVLDPESERALAARKLVNHMLWVASGHRDGPKDPLRSFSAYAAAGENFIAGMRALDEFRVVMGTEADYWLGQRPGKNVEPLFNDDMAKMIENYCKVFRRTEQYIESGDYEKPGPNSKPWLHYCVSRLHGVWCDELRQKPRPKKDFVDFAFEALKPLRWGVTEISVIESFDRYTKKMKLKRQLPQ